MQPALTRYELRHTIAHLLEGKRIDVAYRVLFATSYTGANAWFEAQEAAVDLATYIENVEAVLDCVRMTPEFSPDKELALALLSSMARSLVSAAPAAIVVARVSAGLWNVDDAIRFANEYADPARRARTLLALAERIPAARSPMVLDTIMALAGQSKPAVRAELLPVCLSLLPAGQRASAARDILDLPSSNIRITAIRNALPVVSRALGQRLISAAVASLDEIQPHGAVAATLHSEALLTSIETSDIGDHVLAYKAAARAEVGSYATEPEAHIETAWQLAQSIRAEGLRFQTSARVVRWAPARSRLALVPRLLRGSLRNELRALLLARELASELSSRHLKVLLEVGRRAIETRSKIFILGLAGRALRASDRLRVASELLQIFRLEATEPSNPTALWSAQMVAGLADALSPVEFAEFRALLNALARGDKAGVLITCMQARRDTNRDVVDEVLADIECVAAEKRIDASVLTLRCRSLMGREGLHYFSEVLHQEKESEGCTALLNVLGADVPADVLHRLMRVGRRLPDRSAHVALLATFALNLDGRERHEAVEAAAKIASSAPASDEQLALAALVPALDQPLREHAIRQILQATSERHWLATCIFGCILPHIGSAQREEIARSALERMRSPAGGEHDSAVDVARGTADLVYAAQLAQWLPDDERQSAEDWLLETALRFSDDVERVEALSFMLPHLRSSTRRVVGVAVLQLFKGGAGPERGLVLLNALLACSNSVEDDISDLVRGLRREAEQIECLACSVNVKGALSALATDLSVSDAMACILSITLDWSRSAALRAFVSRQRASISRGDALAAWRLALDARGMGCSNLLNCAVDTLPLLETLGQAAALSRGWRTIVKVAEWWP